MGEKSDAVLMYSIDGEHFTELNEIPEINSFTDTYIDDFGLHGFNGGNITIKLDKKSARRMIALLTPREFTNGWRRQHGLPMIRRTTLRRLKNRG